MKSQGLVLLAFADTRGDVCDLPKVIQNPGGRAGDQIQASEAAQRAPSTSLPFPSLSLLDPGLRLQKVNNSVFFQANMDSGLRQEFLSSGHHSRFCGSSGTWEAMSTYGPKYLSNSVPFSRFTFCGKVTHRLQWKRQRGPFQTPACFLPLQIPTVGG